VDEYKYPQDLNVKIIDFGGATYDDERHSEIINTRQYRAPEVILGSQVWDNKSDVWSLACIFVELYTGELFFPTHDNYEHLCLIEKACSKKFI
jgi:serine/threonine protein kinase